MRFHEAEIIRSAADAVWLSGLPDEITLITVGQGFVRDGQKVDPHPEADAGKRGGARETVAQRAAN